MIKNILFILLGIFLGITINTAFAIYESGSGDAASVVGYGSTGSALVALSVDSTGQVQLH